MNVLIVEDEKSLSDEIFLFLKSEGYLCEQAFTGNDASEKIAINLYDFVLLDLGLPDCDGLDIINNARAYDSEPAFIIITARGEVQDKIKGLDLGADDYIAKPFALPELAARMQAVGRRKFKISGQDMAVGEFVIEFQSRRLTHDGKEVMLTRKEFDLVNYLVVNRNKVLTRQQLYEHIWGNILEDQYDSNFIDVHIKNVRRKLNEFASTPWLETVRGIGYRISL